MPRCRIATNDFRIHKVLSKIDLEPAVSVRGLANLVKLSSSRLGHLFKTETGLELRHFLLEARIEKAASLLRETDMQVKEISHTVGYHHVSSFDRVFRRRLGASPAYYRTHGPSAGKAEDFETVPSEGARNGFSGNG